jgi:multiple sugar transport system ATP-binding protein
MRFAESVALADLSLTVREGEFLTLLGPSGCGKSTTLNLIAGLLEPTRGDIRIGGRRVNGLPPKARHVAMVFQDYALYPHMTVFQNLAFPLRALHLPAAEIRQKVDRVMEILGIAALADRVPKELSGGQRQRVALGRALVRDPQVFLMDEPLSNLDARLRVAMRAELKRLHRQFRATMIYVTHDQAEAMTLSDRIALLRSGVLQQVGTPREIYERPANQFVAGFMGAVGMNFIPCALGAVDGRAALTRGPLQIPLAGNMEGEIRRRNLQSVVVGLRPEHVLVGEGGGTPGIVEVAEYLGSEVLVYVRVGETILISKASASAMPSPDQPVTVGVEWQRACLFDPETESLIGPNEER